MARAIERYFASDLFEELDSRRQEIRDYAAERHSWDVVGQMTVRKHQYLLPPERLSSRETSRAERDVKAPS